MPARSAFRLLFYHSGADGKPLPPDDTLLRHVEALFDTGDRICQLNLLARQNDAGTFAAKFLTALFNALIQYRVMPADLTAGKLPEDAEFLLKNALLLCNCLRELPGTVNMNDSLLPSAGKLFSKLPACGSDLQAFAAILAGADPFSGSRVFNYRNGEFFPVTPSSVKDINKFFGFPGVRLALHEHFRDFSAGKTSLPLLINSLPGYGKTSMVISFALSVPDTVVILPDPGALEESWEKLISALSYRRDHRFVLFFDDIDPRSINWYNFRTNVGGAFTPPENIMPVLTANYEFPPSILSRGRRISYPVFDEERCLEMIEDFLVAFGMKKPPRNIVSLMGAEYTEEFGQKKFTELSPRTLMRHLSSYEKDPRKRKQIVELSGGGMITRPDAELFYEFNIELMRSLYGEEYIQRLLKERLRSL
ncbi:MAG: hypothetical protein IKC94_04505 [Lentisphaeria bacterium]|nr:hypothetical protein [Lentisphaeria bacterium]